METLFVGTNIIFLPEVDSTNSYAIGLLKNVNLPEGTVVHTAHQTAGRGQRGNVWNTLPHADITASIVLNPVFLPLKKQFFLYQVAALACYDVLAEILNGSHNDIKIKWPNDILVNGKKIAGILIENVVMNGAIARSVVGIGLNIARRTFPPGVNATSLEALTGKTFQRDEILRRLCYHLEKNYLFLRSGKSEELCQRYLTRLFAKDEWRDFENGGSPTSYFVKGVDKHGYLLLMDKDGKEHSFDVQEIKWVL